MRTIWSLTLVIWVAGACSGGTSPLPGDETPPDDGDPTDTGDTAAGDGGSLGATLTFSDIGASGWYPSRRDPAVGPCDAADSSTCCMTQHDVVDEGLAPWHEELLLTLRGPMVVEALAVYEGGSGSWERQSHWTSAEPGEGFAFSGDLSDSDFDGRVGNKCLVDVSRDDVFACGSGSLPFCPDGETRYDGWSGSKLFVIRAATPRLGQTGSEALEGTHCSDDPGDNWFDAPWMGLSHAELVRSGKFGGCHCYAKNPDEWWLADGCGQFNAFEVVNDQNQYQNLDLFSTNLFAYHGYVGDGPCGQRCDVSGLAADVDLVDTSTSAAAAQGAEATPAQGPGAAFRRPATSRYFIVLFDVSTRTIQLALIHPDNIPAEASGLLPELPVSVPRSTIDEVLALRLPR